MNVSNSVHCLSTDLKTVSRPFNGEKEESFTKREKKIDK